MSASTMTMEKANRIAQERIAKLEAELKALREGNRVALAEAYRCGYQAGKAEAR